MKIRKLQLKNIGAFDDETIEFQPCPAKDKAEIHIFTGQNGSGKSTILIALVSAFVNAQRTKYTDASGQTGFMQPPNTRNSFFQRFRYFELENLNTNSIYDYKSFSIVELESLISAEEKTIMIGDPESNSIRSIPTFGGFIGSYQVTLSGEVFDSKYHFAAFAYSGYRRIKNEVINLLESVNENPLAQALDFIKDENSKFTINQWLGRNLSKRALAKEQNDGGSEKYEENIKSFEKIIGDVIGHEIRFKLTTDLSLVMTERYENSAKELTFDVLPDGLKSLISWIGDLLMRLDSLKWENDTPIFDRKIALFLDEIEVHLHPEWQRKILPVVQKLFKNSQIFVSTHSPFVVNSVDDAWVYKLKLDAEGKAKVESVTRSEDGNSYSYVLEEIFDIKEEFGIGVQKDLEEFKDLRNKILASNNGSVKLKKDIKVLGRKLAKQSEELNTIVQFEIRQINRRKGTKLTI